MNWTDTYPLHVTLLDYDDLLTVTLPDGEVISIKGDGTIKEYKNDR